MVNQVDYKRLVRAVAGDKYPYQDSLILSLNGDVVQINATNPKTKKRTTHLQMQIPIEEIDNVIMALSDLKRQYTPTVGKTV